MTQDDPGGYAAAVTDARVSIGRARLADPGEHYPYKHDVVTALVEENPPAGPAAPEDAPGGGRDLTSQPIADATRDYVEAQAAYVAEHTEETRAAYEVARDVLVDARRRHRVDRDGFAVVAFRGGE
jgi:hypothetical protein